MGDDMAPLEVSPDTMDNRLDATNYESLPYYIYFESLTVMALEFVRISSLRVLYLMNQSINSGGSARMNANQIQSTLPWPIDDDLNESTWLDCSLWNDAE